MSWCCAIRRSLAPLLLVCAAACDSGGGIAPTPPPATELVVVRRAWAAGEREALLDRIVRTRQLTFPIAGDLSDFAVFVVPADSAAELVRDDGSPTGLTAAGVDLTLVDTTGAQPDTTFLLGWVWWSMTDSTRRGFVFINTSNAVAENIFVDSDSAASASAFGGEEIGTAAFRAAGWTRRNTASVTSNLGIGGPSTITSGPFAGGRMQQSRMTGLLDSVRLDPDPPGSSPFVLYASMTFRSTRAVRVLFTR